VAVVDAILFLDDLMHLDYTTRVLSASSTQAGYSLDNMREADLQRAWKPADSAADEWAHVDSGDVTWLGASGNTVWAAIAYDSRLADQTKVWLQSAAVDDGAFASPTDLASWTISGANALDVNCRYLTFTVPTPQKRHYRLIQKVAERGGLTRTARIFSWAMFSTQLSIPVAMAGASESGYDIAQVDTASVILTAAGAQVGNRYARGAQKFQLKIEPATEAVWKTLRDGFQANGGLVRAIYVQKTGLRNPDMNDFFLCQATSAERNASVHYRGYYDITMEFRTVAWI